MNKILAVLVILCIGVSAFAQTVQVPGFAFTGREISDFSIRPSFKNVSVSFGVQSSFDTYLKQEEFRLNAGDAKSYQTDDPGGIYSGGFGTSVSSVFVGERAYRNNIVKAFLKKDYIGTIESYNKYLPKLEKTAFAEETRLVYAFAMMETGSITKSLGILKDIAVNGKGFPQAAADRVTAYLMNVKDYEGLDSFASKLPAQTPYTLYGRLFALLQMGKPDRLVRIFDANSLITSKDKRFYDFFITARYSQGGFDDVILSAEKATENTKGLLADAYLIKDRRNDAMAVIEKMPDGSTMKKVLVAKAALLKGDLVHAGELLSELRGDEDRLNLLFYYVGKNFPKLDMEFLSLFRFDDRINADYLKFYTGLYHLAAGDEMSAVRYLDAVIFNTELADTAYYYRGLAYTKLDMRRAERYFLKFIETSSDTEKLTVSRFMLAQIRYIAGAHDDALMLLGTCETDYCSVLKARVYLDKEQYELAWNNSASVKGDEAALVRATVLFHKKQYGDALSQIEAMGTKGRDADFLTMLCYLKLDRMYDAGGIFARYKNDGEFTDKYLDHLFLTGQYAEVLKLTADAGRQFELIRAKSMFSLGRYKDSALMFDKIIKSGRHSFDAWNGLLSAYTALDDKKAFADAAKSVTEIKSDFDKKDLLVYQTAVYALDGKDTRLATLLLNYFFESFITSAYKNDAYLLRGKLFRDTGRVQQCLNDAEVMLREGKSEDALFLKGECLQSAKPAEALKIFEDMTLNSGRFRDLGYSKLIELYTRPADILKAVNYFREKDTERYYSGLDTYLSRLNQKELKNNRPLLDEMIQNRHQSGLSAAYYYLGLIEFNDKNYEGAAVLFMKSHYLFPTSKYSRNSLEMTIASYKKAGRTKGLDVLEKKLKAIKK